MRLLAHAARRRLPPELSVRARSSRSPTCAPDGRAAHRRAGASRPLRVSLHASDPDVQRAPSSASHAQHGIDALERLLAAGHRGARPDRARARAKMTARRCERTLEWACERPGHPQTSCVVPSGLHAATRPAFSRSFGEPGSAPWPCSTQIAPFQDSVRGWQRGTPWVFAADEFYLQRPSRSRRARGACRPPPITGTSSMFEDGVGIVRTVRRRLGKSARSRRRARRSVRPARSRRADARAFYVAGLRPARDVARAHRGKPACGAARSRCTSRTASSAATWT